MKTPLASELNDLAKKNGINEQELKNILYFLVEKRSVYLIDYSYIHSSIVDSCRNKLLRSLARKKEGITVADFRNLVEGNRKICLLLLNIYDEECIVKRSNDVRIITENGINYLK